MRRRRYEDNILDPYLTPEEDARLVAIFWAEPQLFCESYLWVSNKELGEMPMIFRSDQQKVYDMIQELRRQGKPIRLIILKSRQVGVSTLIEALIFTFCRLRPNSKALIVAQKQSTADKVYDMFTLFWEKLPDELRPKKARRKTVGMMVLDNKSAIETATAKNTDPARGYALNYGHFTEFSIWPFPEQTLHSIMGGFSEGPESMAAIESTAAGMDGLFYTMWQMAIEGRADGDQLWTPVFLAWWQHDLYELDVTPEEAQDSLSLREMTQTERNLVNKWLMADDRVIPGCYRLAQWQRKIKWRRRKVASDFGGSEMWFNQEYPGSPEDAFLSQGQSMYDQNAIAYYLNTHVRPGRKGHLEEYGRNRRPVFVEGPDGDGEYPLTIWYEPSPNEEYAIGADSALGSRQQAQSKPAKMVDGEMQGTGDYSAAEVFNTNRKQCAEYRKRVIDPAEFAVMLTLLGKYYSGVNNMGALLVPEVSSSGANSSGYGVQYELKKLKYPRLWRWQKFDSAAAVHRVNAVGWEATPKSVQALQKATMRELRRGAGLLNPKYELGDDRDWPRMIIHSKGLLSEMTSYALLDNGDGTMTMGAPKGKHDDRVRAWALSILGMDQLPAPRTVRDKEEQREKVQQLPWDRFGRSTTMDAGGAPSWLRV